MCAVRESGAPEKRAGHSGTRHVFIVRMACLSLGVTVSRSNQANLIGSACDGSHSRDRTGSVTGQAVFSLRLVSLTVAKLHSTLVCSFSSSSFCFSWHPLPLVPNTNTSSPPLAQRSSQYQMPAQRTKSRRPTTTLAVISQSKSETRSKTADTSSLGNWGKPRPHYTPADNSPLTLLLLNLLFSHIILLSHEQLGPLLHCMACE